MAGTWDWGFGELTECTKSLEERFPWGELDILVGQWNFIDWEEAKQKLLPKVLGSVKSTGRTVVQEGNYCIIYHMLKFVWGLAAFCPGWPKPRPSAYTQDLDCRTLLFLSGVPALGTCWDPGLGPPLSEVFEASSCQSTFPGAMVLRPSRMLWGSLGTKAFFMSISWLQAIGSIQHPRSSLSSKGRFKWLLIREGRGAETEEEQSRANSSGTSLVVQWASTTRGAGFIPGGNEDPIAERSNNMK